MRVILRVVAYIINWYIESRILTIAQECTLYHINELAFDFIYDRKSP
jgi:hypothetical protein